MALRKGKRDATSNTVSPGTKRDNGSSLAGNQHVSGVTDVYEIEEKLPWAPAGGFPVHDDMFHAGHRWTEAPGKIQPNSGRGNI